jgi:hypothetical protein
MNFEGDSRFARTVRRFVIEPMIGSAGVGAFAYFFHRASLIGLSPFEDSPLSSEAYLFAIFALSALFMMSILYYFVQRWFAPQTVAVWLGCYTHESDRRAIFSGVEWKEHYQIRFRRFEKPASGTRVEVVTCHRCGNKVRVKLWGPRALLCLRILAVIVIPGVFLALCFTPCSHCSESAWDSPLSALLGGLLGLVKALGLMASVPVGLALLLVSWWVPEGWSWCGTIDGVSDVSYFPSSSLDNRHKVFHEYTKTTSLSVH